MKRRNRQVLTLDDVTEDDIAAVEKTRAPAAAAKFNREVTE